MEHHAKGEPNRLEYFKCPYCEIPNSLLLISHTDFPHERDRQGNHLSFLVDFGIEILTLMITAEAEYYNRASVNKSSKPPHLQNFFPPPQKKKIITAERFSVLWFFCGEETLDIFS